MISQKENPDHQVHVVLDHPISQAQRGGIVVQVQDHQKMEKARVVAILGHPDFRVDQDQNSTVLIQVQFVQDLINHQGLEIRKRSILRKDGILM